LVFVGRGTNIKGIHLLVEAVRQLDPEAYPLEVHFFGPPWNDAYGRQLSARIENDARFCRPRLIAPEDLQEKMQGMHVAVIPSLWPETGPLSLYDAFQAGLPVIASRQGGLAERVEDGQSGFLFAYNDAQDLSRAIVRLFEPGQYEHLRAGVPEVEFEHHLADNMNNIYHRLLIG
jgi:glycosyltransferase involved in cell wall biosynthesis